MERIPAVLEKAPLWCVWKYENTDGGKPTKIPYNPRTGGKAQSNNPSTWSDYRVAQQATARFSGLGIMFSGGVCGIDIDAINDHTEENPLAPEILKLFSGTYAERSPSGKGYHIIFLCDMTRIPTETAKDGKTRLASKYYQHSKRRELECYFSGLTSRFFTFSGNCVSDTVEVTDQTEQVICFLNRYMTKADHTTKDILDIARRSKTGDAFIALYDRGDISGYDGKNEADLALCDRLAYWLNGDAAAIDAAFRQSALYRDKWERSDYSQRTIQNAIEHQNGKFYTGEAQRQKITQETRTDSRRALTLSELETYLAENGISIRRNEITHAVEIGGMSEEFDPENAQAEMHIILHDRLKRDYRCDKNLVSDLLGVIAGKNRYNPVTQLIDSTVWDGVDRQSELLKILHISPNDTLSQTLIYKWMVQALVLAKNDPKSPVGGDGILMIQGRQGIGKTSLVRILGMRPELTRLGQFIDTRDKDTVIRSTSTWICELAEIETTLRSDLERLKAFITAERDMYRTPYSRADSNLTRHTAFIGTCNSERFLIDPTGSRRFWTVPVDEIDLERLNKFDSLQLWAQIEAISKNYRQEFRLTPDEQQQLALRNCEHEKPMKAQPEIEDILADAQQDTAGFNWQFITVSKFKEENSSLHHYTVEQIGRALDRLNITADRKKIEGKVQRVRMLPMRKWGASYRCS